MESPLDVMKHLRAMIETARDKDELRDKIEEVMEDFSGKLDDTAQDLQDGRFEESVKEVMNAAEEGIKEGLKNLGSFINGFTTPPESTAAKKAEPPHKERKVGPDTKDESPQPRDRDDTEE